MVNWDLSFWYLLNGKWSNFENAKYNFTNFSGMMGEMKVWSENRHFLNSSQEKWNKRPAGVIEILQGAQYVLQ